MLLSAPRLALLITILMLAAGLMAPPASGGDSELLTDLNADDYTGSVGAKRLAVVGGNLFFAGSTPLLDETLWMSDGTPGGTVPIGGGQGALEPSFIVEFGGEVWFRAEGYQGNGPQLWRSDGTTAGTFEAFPEVGAEEPSGLFPFNGLLYFEAKDPLAGRELWRTDGTAGGTFMLADIAPGVNGSGPRDFCPYGGELFFIASFSGDEGLWKTDGTTVGTVLVKAFNSGAHEPAELVQMGGRLYFRAGDSTHGRELWTSNGTTAGTRYAVDIVPGSTSGDPTGLTPMGGLLYFAAYDNAAGTELWVSDGTSAGTSLVADINPGDSPSLPQNLFASGDRLWFTATTPDEGREVWTTDGTALGLRRLADSVPGVEGCNFQRGLVIGDTLFYATDEQLWAASGTTTLQLTDRDTWGGHSYKPEYLVDFGGTLFFVAGGRLWSSDGTVLGTTYAAGARPAHVDNHVWPLWPDLARSRFYFSAADAMSDASLWISDGTAGGTEVAAYIPMTSIDSARSTVLPDGRWCANVRSSRHGREPWISDGTAAGTWMLGDIFPGTGDSYAFGFTLFDNRVWFVARAETGGAGDGLYVTDGLPGNATRFFDSTPGVKTTVQAPFVFDGRLWISMDSTAAGKEWWTTDGTIEGTHQFADLVPGPESLDPRAIGFLNGRLVFHGSDGAGGAGGSDIWITDGTVGGTFACGTDVVTVLSEPFLEPIVFGGYLYFRATDGTHGYELWRTDGTPGGTGMLVDLVPGAGSSSPHGLVDLGNGLAVFRADDPDHGEELWVTDGTPGGTQRLLDIVPGAGGSSPADFIVYNGLAWFHARDIEHNRELWTSDGTPGGTSMFADLVPGPESSTPIPLFVMDGLLYLMVDTKDAEDEIWTTDGTLGGTGKAFSVHEGTTRDSLIDELQTDGSRAWLLGNKEVWVSDGAPGNTQRLTGYDLQPALPAPRNPRFLTPFGGGKLAFRGSDSTVGAELWVSDGTLAGLTLFDIWTGEEDSRPDHLAAFGNRVLLSAEDVDQGFEPYITDGSSASLVLDIRAAGGSSPKEFTAVDASTAVFSATDDSNGTELWKTDGTPGGTSMLRDIYVGGGYGLPRNLVRVGSRVFFTARDGAESSDVFDEELWITDGTAAGTRKVKVVRLDGSSSISNMTSAGTRLFFTAVDWDHGSELWTSDGTEAGTTLVDDLTPGSASTIITIIGTVPGRVIFTFDHAATGREPWVSDGTAAGTFMLQDIETGEVGSDPGAGATLDGKLYFVAATAEQGRELWVTDGTPGGTMLADDVVDGPRSSEPQDLAAAADRIFFSAAHPQFGREVWTWTPPAVAPVNHAPQLSVHASGITLGDGDTLDVEIDCPLTALDLALVATDADGDSVSVSTVISGMTTEGLVDSEFETAAVLSPLLFPGTGTFNVADATLTCTVTVDDGAAQTVLTFHLHVVGNLAPRVTVRMFQQTLNDGQTVVVPKNQAVTPAVIMVDDRGRDNVSASCTISGQTSEGLVEAEFEVTAQATPFVLRPTSGRFDMPGATLTITLVLDDGENQTTFEFDVHVPTRQKTWRPRSAWRCWAPRLQTAKRWMCRSTC